MYDKGISMDVSVSKSAISTYSSQAHEIKIGGMYKHYKGSQYKVIAIARHSEDHQEMVVYQALSDSAIWVRPLAMFCEKVEVIGQLIPRFSYMPEEHKIES